MIDFQDITQPSDSTYWSLTPDERDLRIRLCAYGDTPAIPLAELCAHKDFTAYRLMENLNSLGVTTAELWRLGVIVWGFFAPSSYSDAWVTKAYTHFYQAGALEGVLNSLQKLGVTADILVELRGLPIDTEATEMIRAEITKVSNISEWTKQDWYAEVEKLLKDAELEGSRGFNVRKELLLLIAKERGFVSENLGESALTAALTVIANQGASLISKYSRRVIDTDCEVVDNG